MTTQIAHPPTARHRRWLGRKVQVGRVGVKFAFRLIALLLALAVPVAPAQVLYKWVDEKGRVHYGEKPPAGSKPSALKPPAAAPAAPAKAQDLPSQEREFRRRQLEKREEEARQERDAANREERCNNAKERLAIAERAALYRREKGERVFLSDAEQKAEVESRRADVTQYCR